MSKKDDDSKKKKNLTVLLVAGRLPVGILDEVSALAREYDFGLYLTTIQNLRLVGVAEEDAEAVKKRLTAAGAIVKTPGMFPKPRVCAGMPQCNLGIIDTEELSKKIWARFGGRKNVKPKYKIAIAACPASCSNALLADIGIVATRAGYDIYAGGKGGTRPRAGSRIVRNADEDKVLSVIERIADFHDQKAGQKMRIYKLLSDPEFPFPVKE